jgi:hypothetical protein
LEQFILDLRFRIPLIQSVEVIYESYCVEVTTMCLRKKLLHVKDGCWDSVN